ncbi:hypothetical protein PFICI_10745 [Pestalotiopsis fici W106-1]|uniref:CENP-V/GFA domain-containing protein n=1 Tax=Pestalotiopsis fici (strain W106-1 / CGMCC3.15140) TaxID=1229662 RepID=W3WVK4_PESFW|nr:uncharacterized protein PFICI_10745 [Pestalotiopsis fici W106-1]ETS76871.1 hypothetical protein PFICI_10745 [Pestalotiopsis fici W106-1]
MANIMYHGNCHCGAYRFEVALPKITQVIACDCSLCAKKGHLWVVPSPSEFKVTRDDGKLVKYRSEALHNQFCNICASPVLGEHVAGPLAGKLAINARTILEIDPFEFEVANIHTDDHRETPSTVSSDGTGAIHKGSCHCGKVLVELLTPLEDELSEDNCSACRRVSLSQRKSVDLSACRITAQVLTYPTKEQVRIDGKEHTLEYARGNKWTAYAFCGTCGVSMFVENYGPPEGASFFDRVPAERREFVLSVYQKNINSLPVQVRSLDSVDLGSLKVQRKNTGTEGYVLDP